MHAISSISILTQTIVIEMPNFIIKFIADIIGGEEGKETWESHLREELSNLKRLIETVSTRRSGRRAVGTATFS